MLRDYFNCNKIFGIFLTSFCNILCYVGLYIDICDAERAYVELFDLRFFPSVSYFTSPHVNELLPKTFVRTVKFEKALRCREDRGKVDYLGQSGPPRKLCHEYLKNLKTGEYVNHRQMLICNNCRCILICNLDRLQLVKYGTNYRAIGA